MGKEGGSWMEEGGDGGMKGGKDITDTPFADGPCPAVAMLAGERALALSVCGRARSVSSEGGVQRRLL